MTMPPDDLPNEAEVEARWFASMFERYTERARRVIFFAREEAVRFGSTTIESEHLLLGLIREDQNLTNRFMRNHWPIVSIRIEIEGRTAFREKVSTSIDLPLSNECKRILAYAAEEAERLNHRHIGTEHLLLGILREERCMAAQILQQYGLRLNAIREELARSMNVEPLVMPRKMGLSYSSMHNPIPPKSGVVPDAETAKRIAEALWTQRYDAETVARQAPVQAELKFNVWIVTGTSSAEAPLFAFIHQADGQILDIGGPTKR
jgi:ATP-dependent Clp protease ATP-binding subunit ClpA